MKYRIREQNELKPSGLHWIDYLPKDWQKASLKYILNYVIGSTPSTSKDKYFFGDNIWVSISDIKDKYISDAKQRLSDEAIIDCNIKKVPKGSLLYSFKLSVGQMSFNTVDLYTNEAIASFINNENVNLNFWYYALGKYLIEYSNENIYGAKLLNQDLIKNARLLVPSQIEQQKIANFLDEKSKIFDEAISKKEQLISKLEFAKQSLISEVVTGKLKVVEQNSKLQTIKREQNELKASGVEWLGDIPKDWEIKKLKYISEIISSNVDKKSYEEQEKVLLCNYVDVYKNDFITNKIDFMEATASESEIKKFSLQLGDILITKDSESPNDIAIPAYVNEKFENVLCGYHLSILRNNKNKVYSEYLYRFFQLIGVRNYFETMAKGVTRYGLSLDAFKNVFVPHFDITEQKQISKYLDEKLIHFDNTIEKTKQSIKKLKGAKEALISQAVTGKIEVL